MPRKHVISAADDAYVQHYAVMLASFLDFNPHQEYTFHLLTTELTAESHGKLRDFVRETNIDLRLIDIRGHIAALDQLKVTQHVSLATYFRFLIPSVVSADIEMVLYLDVDLLIQGEVGSLFDLDLGEYAVAAVPDPLGERYYRDHRLARPEDYFNAGVLLINLVHWRKHDVATQALDYARQHPEKLHCWDQCALNAVLKDHVYYLDRGWNRQEKSSNDSDSGGQELEVVILHFSGPLKPWLYVCELPSKPIYWVYLKRTPWRGFVPPDRTPLNRLKRALPASTRRAIRRVWQRAWKVCARSLSSQNRL